MARETIEDFDIDDALQECINEAYDLDDEYEYYDEDEDENDTEIERLKQLIDNSYYPEVEPDDYDDVMSFWKDVDSHYDRWKTELAENFGTTVEGLDEFIKDEPECSEYTYPDEWLPVLFNSYYVDAAEEKWPEMFEYEPDYHCKVCGKPIKYSSMDSVMLTENNWKEVVATFGLEDYEQEAMRREIETARYYFIHGNMKMAMPDDCHLFICNDCMEEALGHPLEPDDINDSPFNREYRVAHFSPKLQPDKPLEY